MKTKLTLRLDEALIRKAKRYSSRSGKSISQIVSDYLRLIDAGTEKDESDGLSPRVRSLVGALSGHRVAKEDHRRHLEAKHR